MPRVIRWVGYAAAASLLLALAGAAVVYAMSERVVRARHVISAPAFSTPLPTDSASLAEGERIAWTRGCQGCHGAQLEGKVFFSEPRIATLVAPNLTRLVPVRSDADLERALRHGLRPDGTTLLSMPSEMLRSLTDDDVARLIAWLRTQAPVDGNDGGRLVGPLGRVGLVGGQFRTSRYYIETETPLPPPADAALRLGHYIATTTCTECHGNEMQGVDGSPALPPIVQAYARDEFAEFLRTGTAKGGRELPMMSPVARGRFVHLTGEEVDGLYSYLLSLALTPKE